LTYGRETLFGAQFAAKGQLLYVGCDDDSTCRYGSACGGDSVIRATAGRILRIHASTASSGKDRAPVLTGCALRPSRASRRAAESFCTAGSSNAPCMRSDELGRASRFQSGSRRGPPSRHAQLKASFDFLAACETAAQWQRSIVEVPRTRLSLRRMIVRTPFWGAFRVNSCIQRPGSVGSPSNSTTLPALAQNRV